MYLEWVNEGMKHDTSFPWNGLKELPGFYLLGGGGKLPPKSFPEKKF